MKQNADLVMPWVCEEPEGQVMADWGHRGQAAWPWPGETGEAAKVSAMNTPRPSEGFAGIGECQANASTRFPGSLPQASRPAFSLISS